MEHFIFQKYAYSGISAHVPRSTRTIVLYNNFISSSQPPFYLDLEDLTSALRGILQKRWPSYRLLHRLADDMKGFIWPWVSVQACQPGHLSLHIPEPFAAPFEVLCRQEHCLRLGVAPSAWIEYRPIYFLEFLSPFPISTPISAFKKQLNCPSVPYPASLSSLLPNIRVFREKTKSFSLYFFLNHGLMPCNTTALQ